MGPLGTQELVVIFLLALLLFGPKKLPELGRTIGKAMTEFRRAQSELKATFDREMRNLEQETGIRELTATSYQSNSYNYDYSNYDSSYYDGSYDSSLTNTLTAGASATEGAAHEASLQVEAAPGSIASGHLLEAGHPESSEHVPAPVVAPASTAHETGHSAPEHQAEPAGNTNS
jgi:TatA/E family protein of Tat protein translocase